MESLIAPIIKGFGIGIKFEGVPEDKGGAERVDGGDKAVGKL